MISRVVILLGLVLLYAQVCAGGPHAVEVKENQLHIDNEAQPQLFGAEVQYFRLRGGYGPNVPRQTVIELWNKALDKVVEAKMNAISFYIPWDFHEYADGKFDFTGTVDEDGDGNPDYPSRDLVTFFRLIKEHGIKRIMVRPGPYINAEWGYLGFGAIPEWFQDKYPESHMMNSSGLRTKLFDYLDPTLLKRTQTWFETLYNQVLKDNIGDGKPIVFVQLDNETNYQWGSLYNNDYSPRAVARYQDFLKNNYQNDLAQLNRAHGRQWTAWNLVAPPVQPGLNIAEDQDWYRFADFTMASFLHEVRKIWEGLGIGEPKVIFTSAESYNAADHGILPNYVLRNAPQVSGLMTVNLYPKTFETTDSPLSNTPFKADLDVKAATEANGRYWGSRQEWAMGPEIQAGWWQGINVTNESRQQTYLTVVGHGLKSFFLYYFSEGDNWGVHWAHDKVQPVYENLRKDWNVGEAPATSLTDAFWKELQDRVDKLLFVDLDVRGIILNDVRRDETLFFDSPLDGNALPRDHFAKLKELGEKVIGPYQDFLGRATEVVDEVALVKDVESHVPSLNPAINALWASADWAGGLLGYVMNADINPAILIDEISDEKSFTTPKLLLHIDAEVNGIHTLKMLGDAFKRGQSVVNFIGNQVSQSLGFNFPEIVVPPSNPETLTAYFNEAGQLVSRDTAKARAVNFSAADPLFTYDLKDSEECQAVLYYKDQVAGYRCRRGQNTFVQVGALIFGDYNSSGYAKISDAAEKKGFLKALLADANVKPVLEFSDDALQTVAFARKDPKKDLIWITVKTGMRQNQKLKLRMMPNLLSDGLQVKSVMDVQDHFNVTDLISQKKQTLTFSQLVAQGLSVELGPDGSTVFIVERAQ